MEAFLGVEDCGYNRKHLQGKFGNKMHYRISHLNCLIAWNPYSQQRDKRNLSAAS